MSYSQTDLKNEFGVKFCFRYTFPEVCTTKNLYLTRQFLRPPPPWRGPRLGSAVGGYGRRLGLAVGPRHGGGCIIMALGGLLSLTDRRFRVAAGARKAAAQKGKATICFFLPPALAVHPSYGEPRCGRSRLPRG